MLGRLLSECPRRAPEKRHLSRPSKLLHGCTPLHGCTMCFELDVDGIASAADIALNGGSGGTSFCSQLGGVASCSRLCESLGSDACWDSYLRVLAGDPRFGSTLESWLVLQHASDRCHAAGISGRAVSCGDWSRLSPLQPAYRLDVLCAPSCVWPRSLAPAALDLINSTLPHADKATFCSRRADNTYCAALAASSTGCMRCFATAALFIMRRIISRLLATPRRLHANGTRASGRILNRRPSSPYLSPLRLSATRLFRDLAFHAICRLAARRQQ